jgi:hypothetical protein
LIVGSAYGVAFRTDLDLPGAWRAQPDEAPPLDIRPAAAEEVERLWSGAVEAGWSATIDGRPFAVEHGREGDLLMTHDGVGAFHVTSDRSTLRAAELAAGRPAFLRVLLDSVLFSIALDRGGEALHAAAVERPEGVVAVAGAAGAGKSALAAALRARGAAFFTDDVLALESGGDAVRALPGPPVITTSAPEGEVIVGVEGAPRPAPLAAVIVLTDPAAPREERHQPVFDILTHLLRYPRTKERERQRFALAAAIAEHARIVRLPARSAAPAELAARALAALEP